MPIVITALRSISTVTISLSVIFTLIPSPVQCQWTLPDLPEPVTNNAIAKVNTSEGLYLLSFMGLGVGKTNKDVHNKVWALNVGDRQWHQRKAVPSSLTLKGRLASVAVGIGDKAYVFGGYSVAEDHSEISSPDNYAYDVLSDSYKKIASTPVPVDDSVALVYQQRYIYLISGWHNDGNINLVQIYDVQTNRWQQASPFPGVPVFGHAAGISENLLIVCDGVGVQARVNQRRSFLPEPACYSGSIDQHNINKIDWQLVPHPTGIARYRMAATAISHPHAGIIFIGGSVNPYNYNGIGYNGKPSTADNKLWFFNFEQQQWQLSTTPTSTMDHRGLLLLNENSLIIIGGMQKQQQVSNKVTVIRTDVLQQR
ncbi:MAG: galactose oxidase [Gammaproteobacteria bacterium]|nr:galactose oxidase [Gammaproteobacteria bacterium]